jgi:hypothetical protein
MPTVSILISALSLIVSSIAICLTLWRGQMKMTRPTIFGILYDHSNGHEPRTKIYLRSLLFSSSKRGQAIESMHVTLRRNETQQTFSIWAFGELKDMKVGGGLYVPESGIVGNHHFVVSPNDGNYVFRSGTYELKVFATIVGKENASLMFSQIFDLSSNEAEVLQDPQQGILFTWGPDSRRYHPTIDRLRPDTQTIQAVSGVLND